MTKKVNYSDENIALMESVYDIDASDSDRKSQVDSLAETLGKTAASIRAKLSSLGVYKAMAKPEPKGSRITKSAKIAEIADFAGKRNDAFFDSLQGANSDVLDFILETQTALFDFENPVDPDAESDS
jgi:hypothetical protein